MNRVRRRMAVGIFASVRDAEQTISRLDAIGVSRHDCSLLPADQAPSEPALSGLAPGQIMLRIPLISQEDERAVAGVLLSSAACSVQLHDLD